MCMSSPLSLSCDGGIGGLTETESGSSDYNAVLGPSLVTSVCARVVRLNWATRIARRTGSESENWIPARTR